MKGYISSQKTVWCGKCNAWEYIDNSKNARNRGWKSNKVYGWICPKCQCKHNNLSDKEDTQGRFCFDCKRYIKKENYPRTIA